MLIEHRALDEASCKPDGSNEEDKDPGIGSGVLSSPPTLPVLLLLVVSTTPFLYWTRFCAV